MSGRDKAREQARYAQLVERLMPKSEMGLGLLRAFWVGGVICAIGQAIMDVYANWLLLGAQALEQAEGAADAQLGLI